MGEQNQTHWTERRAEEDRRWIWGGEGGGLCDQLSARSVPSFSLSVYCSLLFISLSLPLAFEATVNTGVFAFTPGAPRSLWDTGMTPAKFPFLFYHCCLCTTCLCRGIFSPIPPHPTPNTHFNSPAVWLTYLNVFYCPAVIIQKEGGADILAVVPFSCYTHNKECCL